jgi:beta-phosphoglucomutase-like phosphatase (HAD superfamily)
LKEDVDLGVFAHKDRPWPDQFLEAAAALGGRFGPVRRLRK